MPVINDEARARRIARAILSDIKLYRGAQLEAGADLSEDLTQGRELFESRVVPDLHWVFDEAAAEVLPGQAPRLLRVPGESEVPDEPEAVGDPARAASTPDVPPAAVSDARRRLRRGLLVGGLVLLVALLYVLGHLARR